MVYIAMLRHFRLWPFHRTPRYHHDHGLHFSLPVRILVAAITMLTFVALAIAACIFFSIAIPFIVFGILYDVVVRLGHDYLDNVKKTDSSTTRTVFPVDVCAICLDDLMDGGRTRSLKECQHVFHKKCVEKWLIKEPSCPVCRASVRSGNRESRTVAAGVDDEQPPWESSWYEVYSQMRM